MSESPIVPLSQSPSAKALVAVWLMADDPELDSSEALLRAEILLEEPELNFTPEELMLLAAIA